MVRVPVELESAVVIADREGLPEPLAGFRSTSLAVWKRQAARSAEATLLLPLDGSRAESWSSAEAVLRRLHRVKRPPTLYLHFRNTLSAGVWVDRLAGVELEQGLSQQEVEDWLEGLGWSVAEKRSIEAPESPERGNGLAPATSRALANLLRQLNPSAAGDYWLWRVEVGARETRGPVTQERVPGRLSVVLQLGQDDRADELDRTLFALSCQEHRAVEWVVCGARQSSQVRAILGRHRKLSGARILRAADVNDALELAMGQYLVFAAPGLVVYPGHYAQQIERIAASDRAWSWATARQVELAQDGAGVLHVTTKRTVPSDERLEPLAFAREPVALYAAVIDRSRLGAFALRFQANEAAGQLLWRLSALFEPLFSPGLPELELRGERPIAEVSPEGLAVLRTVESWNAALELARQQVRGSGMRRQFVDRLNEEVKRRLPRMHHQLKKLVQRWLSAP